MSFSDVVRTCLLAAGVDFDAMPLTWNVSQNSDGTVSHYACWNPGVQVTSSNPAAGNPQSLDNVTVPHRADISAGPIRKLNSASVAGKCQPHSSAGKRQPKISPPTFKQAPPPAAEASQSNSTGRSYMPPQRKTRTPSQRRRSARRRAAWRKTLAADAGSSDVLQKILPSPVTVVSQPQPLEHETVDSQPLPVSSAAVAIQQPSDISPAADVSVELVHTGEKPHSVPVTSPVADVIQPPSDVVQSIASHMPSPLTHVKREKLPEYMPSDGLPGAFFRTIVETDSDDDLPLTDPGHPGHLAYLWAKANCE